MNSLLQIRFETGGRKLHVDGFWTISFRPPTLTYLIERPAQIAQFKLMEHLSNNIKLHLSQQNTLISHQKNEVKYQCLLIVCRNVPPFWKWTWLAQVKTTQLSAVFAFPKGNNHKKQTIIEN